MPIKTVAFDMNGTYAHVNSHRFYKETGKDLGISAAHMRKDFHRSFGPLLDGSISESAFWKRFGKKYGKEITEMEVNESWRKTLKDMRINPGMKELVSGLKKNYKVGMITNTFGSHYKFVKGKGWYKPFNPLVVSCFADARKPGRKIYDIFLKRAGAKPSETVLVDNERENVESAKKIGMKAILFKDAQQVRKDLKRMGVEI